MKVILFLWVISAGAGKDSYHAMWKSSWQYAGEFSNSASCHKAASNLGVKQDEYRCISTSGDVK